MNQATLRDPPYCSHHPIRMTPRQAETLGCPRHNPSSSSQTLVEARVAPRQRAEPAVSQRLRLGKRPERPLDGGDGGDAVGDRYIGLDEGSEQQRCATYDQASCGEFTAVMRRDRHRVVDQLSRKASKATASTPRESSMHLVLARRPNPASSKGAAASPTLSLPVSDTTGHADAASDATDRGRHRVSCRTRLLDAL
jgi:hypothetical protein